MAEARLKDPRIVSELSIVRWSGAPALIIADEAITRPFLFDPTFTHELFQMGLDGELRDSPQRG